MSDLFDALRRDFTLLDAMIEINRLQKGEVIEIKSVHAVANIFRDWLKHYKYDVIGTMQLSEFLSEQEGVQFRQLSEFVKALKKKVANLEAIKPGTSAQVLERELKFLVALHSLAIAMSSTERRRLAA